MAAEREPPPLTLEEEVTKQDSDHEEDLFKSALEVCSTRGTVGGSLYRSCFVIESDCLPFFSCDIHSGPR